MTDQLSSTDQALLHKALEAAKHAESILRFVSNHLAETYQLTEQDTLNPDTGTITRHAASA